MVQIRVEKTDGSQELFPVTRSEVDRDLNKQTEARIGLSRTEANTFTWDEGDDEVTVRDNSSDQWSGVLENKRYQDDSAILTVKSFQEYAELAKPAKAKLPYTNAQDKTIVQEAVDGVSQLSKGNIESIEPGVDIVFNHATRALQIRLMRDLSRGYVRYNSDKTVDYTSSLGTDRTGTTLSPANQNLTRSRVQQSGGEGVLNHLRMIGAGANSVNVEADSFSSGNRERWGRAVFKDVSSTELLTRLGKTLLAELSTDWQEVDATLTGLNHTPSLGDTYTVDYPEQQIDTAELEVVRLQTVRDNTGVHHNATLSNRQLARKRAFETHPDRQSNNVRAGQTTESVNIPNANIPFTRVPANSTFSTTIEVGTDDVVYVWRSNIRALNQAGTPATTVTAQVVSNPHTPSSTVEFESAAGVNGSPLVEIENKSIIDFRINNGDNSEHELAASWSYSIAPNAGA